MKLKITEFVFSLLLAIFSGTFLFIAKGFSNGSDVFPVGVLTVMTIICLAIASRYAWGIKQELAIASPATEVEPFFIHPKRFWLNVGLSVLFVIAMAKIGFFTSSVIFFVVCNWMNGFRRWRTVATTTIVFLILVYLVFVKIFLRPLPKELILSLFQS